MMVEEQLEEIQQHVRNAQAETYFYGDKAVFVEELGLARASIDAMLTHHEERMAELKASAQARREASNAAGS